jgi:hypothetical protein
MVFHAADEGWSREAYAAFYPVQNGIHAHKYSCVVYFFKCSGRYREPPTLRLAGRALRPVQPERYR